MHHFSRFPWEVELGQKAFIITENDEIAYFTKQRFLKDKDPEERLKYIAWERSKNEPS